MTLGLYDFGDAGSEAKKWRQRHDARVRKLNAKKKREEIAANKKIVKAQDAIELKIRMIAYRLKRKERKRLGLSCKGLPPRINKSQIKDMTGMRFGRLTVVRMAPRSKSYGRNRACYVKCDCPRCGVHLVKASNLRQGILRSCGCLTIEVQRRRKGEKRAKPLSEKLMIEARNLRNSGNIKLARLLELSAPAVRICERKRMKRKKR